ncbi:hypothetical protein GT354_18580 [Streptomyces sp. SID3343]|nr:hypothetical protein [Streptomyces sp. SID3343]
MPAFAGPWERYDVAGRKPARKTFHHPRADTITLTPSRWNRKALPADTSACTWPNPMPPITTPRFC